MNSHIIILAQGSQKRLPDLPVAKQMLPLPACGQTPILYRTLRQLWHLLGGINVRDGQDDGVTVVTWYPLMEQLSRRDNITIPAWKIPGTEEAVTYHYTPRVDTLSDPGNSSLKGIDRFLTKQDAYREAYARQFRIDPERMTVPERQVVLLGDVVYSWDCLAAILHTAGSPIGWRFVGTSTLSPSIGELWGLSWERRAEAWMRIGLAAALEKHPPFSDYQCGQMRRWLWSMREISTYTREKPESYSTKPDGTEYFAVDDYTMDIDVPAHVEMLPELSQKAAVDDKNHGVTWP